MARFNTVTKTGATSPIVTVEKTTNTDGKEAFIRDAKSELFLLAVSNFVGKDTFCEAAQNRDDRFSSLVRKVVVEDSRWGLDFVKWLRNEAFMRSASIVAAVEGAKALYDSGVMNGTPRALVAAAQARADEPGEVLAYYESKYGKNFPAFLKKGVADGAKRLYNEYSLLKYDTDSKGYRFADVLQLTHAKANSVTQNDLFQYALNRRYGVAEASPLLQMVNTRANLMSVPVEKRKDILGTSIGRKTLKTAGMTWEALSGWLQGPMDKAAWEAVIPNMGYMALLRNLRNFQLAGISSAMEDYVIKKISSPDEVAKSKQFPFRFLAAYNANKNSLTWSRALEKALNASLSNVPELNGNTLILVDRSGSMFHTDDRNDLSRADQAAIFGIALALRAENATLVQYGDAWYGSHESSLEVPFRKNDAVLPLLAKFKDLGGTDTTGAIKRHLTSKHTRVILITDEQYNGYGANPTSAVPANIPMYTWNLGGYKAAHSESGKLKRHTFGGLTDKGFQMIPLIEAGQSQKWPWEVANKS